MNSGYMLFKTTNGGYNWLAQTNYPNIALVGSIVFLNNFTGWTVGGGGYIYHTTNGGISYVKQISLNVPDNFKLYQNYPNPFNQCTIINVQLSMTGYINLDVYDISGRHIKTLINQKQTKGIYETKFDAGNLSTGIYFYSLVVDGKLIDTKKLVLLK